MAVCSIMDTATMDYGQDPLVALRAVERCTLESIRVHLQNGRPDRALTQVNERLAGLRSADGCHAGRCMRVSTRRRARPPAAGAPRALSAIAVVLEAIAPFFDARSLVALRRTCRSAALVELNPWAQGRRMGDSLAQSLAWVACASAFQAPFRPFGEDLSEEAQQEVDNTRAVLLCNTCFSSYRGWIDWLRTVEVARRKFVARVLWDEGGRAGLIDEEAVDVVQRQPFDRAMAEYLLFHSECGSNIEASRLLVRACEARNIAAARFLMLEAGALPYQALHVGAGIGDLNLMALLCTANMHHADHCVRHRWSGSLVGLTPLGTAIHAGRVEVARWLIEEAQCGLNSRFEEAPQRELRARLRSGAASDTDVGMALVLVMNGSSVIRRADLDWALSYIWPDGTPVAEPPPSLGTGMDMVPS